jgi:hypothetical protein
VDSSSSAKSHAPSQAVARQRLAGGSLPKRIGAEKCSLKQNTCRESCRRVLYVDNVTSAKSHAPSQAVARQRLAGGSLRDLIDAATCCVMQYLSRENCKGMQFVGSSTLTRFKRLLSDSATGRNCCYNPSHPDACWPWLTIMAGNSAESSQLPANITATKLLLTCCAVSVQCALQVYPTKAAVPDYSGYETGGCGCCQDPRPVGVSVG